MSVHPWKRDPYLLFLRLLPCFLLLKGFCGAVFPYPIRGSKDRGCQRVWSANCRAPWGKFVISGIGLLDIDMTLWWKKRCIGDTVSKLTQIYLWLFFIAISCYLLPGSYTDPQFHSIQFYVYGAKSLQKLSQGPSRRAGLDCTLFSLWACIEQKKQKNQLCCYTSLYHKTKQKCCNWIGLV